MGGRDSVQPAGSPPAAELLVIWRITERCALACPFCGYARDQVRPRRESNPARIVAAASQLAAHGRASGRPVHVSWLGGEPLAWPPLAVLDEHLSGALGLRLSATTNGAPLDDASLRRRVVRCYEALTVSLDGLAATHERLRRWPGGFGVLRRGIEALVAERGARSDPATAARAAPIHRRCPPTLRVNVLLQRDNLAELPALCRELARWGADELTFNALGGQERPDYYPDHRLRPAELRWLAARLPDLAAELADQGLRVLGAPEYLARLLAAAEGRAMPGHGCTAGREHLFIDGDRLVAPCAARLADLGRPLPELPDLLRRWAAGGVAQWPATAGPGGTRDEDEYGGPSDVAQWPATAGPGGAVVCRDCRDTRLAGKYRVAASSPRPARQESGHAA